MREIVHWHENFFPVLGGGPAYIENLILNLDNGFRHKVVTDSLPGLPHRGIYAGRADVLRFPRLPVVPQAMALRKRALFLPLRILRELQALSSKFSYLRKARFDLLHVHGVVPYNGLLTISRLLKRNVFRRFLDFSTVRKPRILTLHNFLPGFTEDHYLLELYDHFIHQFDMIICVDEPIYEYCCRLNGLNGGIKVIRYIPNSVDTQRFFYVPHRRDPHLRIGFAGRATDTIDVEMINRFICHLPEGLHLRMAIAGDHRSIMIPGPMAPRVKIFEDLPQSEMPGFYQDVDVVFNPVLHEGITRVSMEAMSCGRPVIMYRTRTPRRFIQQRNSFIIERDYQELMELMRLLTKNPEMIENKGREACRTARDQFSNAAVLIEVRKAYDEVFTKGPVEVTT